MDSKVNDEFVVCLEEATGKEIWRTRIDSSFRSGEGNGPRSTPTVDGGIVFALGAQGTIAALNRRTGNHIWAHNLQEEFGGKVPGWGICSSPLVEGAALIVPVGGARGNAVMAFDKKMGTVLWKSHTDEPGYSSPIAATIGGVRQIIVFSGTQIFAVASADGKLLWSYPWQTGGFVNAALPILIPPNRIFISSSYDQGAALLSVAIEKGQAKVKEIWVSKVMMNHFSSSVLRDNYLYGFDNGILKCIEAGTGREKWAKSGYGKGSLILAEGHLIILTERGLLVIAEASPVKFQEKSSAQVLQGRCFISPALANRKLFLRNQKELISLNLALP